MSVSVVIWNVKLSFSPALQFIAMADPASTASPADLQKVLEEYKQMHRECKALTQKMAELDGEMSEHR